MTRGRPPICIHCGSSHSSPKGSRRTKYLGIRRIRLCRDCGRKFTPRHQKIETPVESEKAPDSAEGLPAVADTDSIGIA